MAFPTFGKKKEVAIPDDCFVEIIWNDEQNPNKLDNLKAIIDLIDQEVLVESHSTFYLSVISGEGAAIHLVSGENIVSV